MMDKRVKSRKDLVITMQKEFPFDPDRVAAIQEAIDKTRDQQV
jgi:hypothetical protein